MRWNGFAAVIAATVWLCSSAWGHAADAALIAAAKSEGRVIWYTTQIINQFVRPAAEAFEKKYGIKVDYVRTNTTELVLRIENESKAGRVQADVFDGTGAAGALKKSGAVMQWVPEAAGRFGSTYVDAEGYWAATNVYVLTPGYNTDLIAKGTQPRTYEDLLDPKWRGKIVWNASQVAAAGTGFIGTVLAAMGEEKGLTYLRKLARQNIAGILQAPRAGLDQVIAGGNLNDHALAAASFDHLDLFGDAAPESENFRLEA
jgi:iron(III) transport system substrate-binding protein